MKKTYKLYEALKTLLNDDNALEYIWNDSTYTLHDDRFFKKTSTFLHTCINSNLHYNVRYKHIAILLEYATQKKYHNFFWKVWVCSNSSLLYLLNELDDITMQNNIEYIEKIYNNCMYTDTSIDFLIKVLPKCSINTQLTIWNHKLKYTKCSLVEYISIFNTMHDTKHKELLLNHVEKYLLKNWGGDIFIEILKELNHPKLLKIPVEFITFFEKNTNYIDEKININIKRLNDRKVSTKYSPYIDYDEYDHSSYISPFIGAQNAFIDSAKELHIYAWLDNMLVSILEKYVPNKDSELIKMWEEYDSIIFFPKIVKWYIDQCKRCQQELSTNIEFAAKVYNIFTPISNPNWFIAYIKYRRSISSILYRDYYISQYSDQEIVQWLIFLYEYTNHKSYQELKSPMWIKGNYTPGDLIHPSEWEHAIKAGDTNIITLEFQYLLKRWIKNVTNKTVEELNCKIQFYKESTDGTDVKIWEILLADLQHNYRDTPVQPLHLEDSQ